MSHGAVGYGSTDLFEGCMHARSDAHGDQRQMTCPLCRGGVEPFAEAYGRAYHRCGTCGLVFLDPALRLESADEQARYETHQNDPDDPRYRTFLQRLAGPLTERVASGSHGLDYGSGPGPTLSVMLEERGF